MINVLANCISIEQYNFFKRFVADSCNIQVKVALITNRLSVYLKSRKEHIDCYLVRNANENQTIAHSNKSIELLSNQINEQIENRIYVSYYRTIDNIKKKHDINYLFIWNGSHASDIALTDYANKHGISTVFFELANIRGKLFVDQFGVNARSSIFFCKEKLDSLDYDQNQFESWKQGYLKDKLSSHFVQQAKLIRKVNLCYIIDLIGFVFFDLVRDTNDNIVSKIKKILAKNRVIYNYDNIDYKSYNYVFYPMQVTNDSQLLLNSNINNFDAILYALKIAESCGLKLIVKPHPAETNQETMKKLNSYKNKYGFFIVNENTFKLIERAQKIVTINSTIGLEALLMKKELYILGKAIYSEFDYERMAKYIMSYLIDIDYFSDKNINNLYLREILNRSSAGQA